MGTFRNGMARWCIRNKLSSSSWVELGILVLSLRSNWQFFFSLFHQKTSNELQVVMEEL
ncbi:hypothetical protein Hdeb2414_s0009g00306761 [Helianthus debilis subsp. tardiflorus]